MSAPFSKKPELLTDEELLEQAEWEIRLFDRPSVMVSKALMAALRRHLPGDSAIDPSGDDECGCYGLSHREECPKWVMPL